MHVPWILLLPVSDARILATLPSALKMPAVKQFNTNLSVHVRQSIEEIPQTQTLAVTKWNVKVVKIVPEIWLATRKTSDASVMKSIVDLQNRNQYLR